MSNHRINIIATLSAIALCAAPSLTAQTGTTRTQDKSSGTRSTTSATAPPTSDATSSDDSAGQQPSASPSPSSPTEHPTPSREPADSTAASTSSSQRSSTTPATPETQTSTAFATSGDVTRATDAADASSVAKLKGQRVHGSDGKELGKIHDFIIDGSSGEIAHVVISTGGMLGVGDKLRLIAPTSVKHSEGDGFNVDMAQPGFRALPAISSRDLDAGRYPAHTSQGPLVRASQLDDKSIRSDNSEVGELQHVVIDFESGKAMALVEANAGFAGAHGKFLIPFNKLEVRSGDAANITTSLLRSDFPAEQAPGTTGASSLAGVATAPVTSAPSDTERQSALSSDTTVAGGIASSTRSSSAGANAPSSSPSPSSSSSSSSATSRDAEPTTSESSTSGIASSSSTDRSTQSTASSTSSPSTSAPRSDVSSPKQSSSSQVAGVSSPTTGTPTAATDVSQLPATADTANTAQAPATTTPPFNPDQEPLTPTGRTSAEQGPASAATAMAIRRAIDNDSTLAGENVQVTTKIVLRGSVANEEAKKRAEEIARKSANNAEIDNEITVEEN